MNKKIAGIGVGVLVACVLIATIFFAEKTSAPSSSASNAPSVQTQQPTTNENTKTYTKTEVASHASPSDCWTIVNGSIYDITSYVPRHPGGDEVLAACGTDSTTLFTQRKTSSGESVGSGTPHSTSAQKQLASFKIGILAP
jgi:cytochrome b involved in lipid metabolism